METADISGKVIIVTGAGNGIGKETAAAVARAGGIPVIADVDVSAAEAAADTIRSGSQSALAIGTNIADPDSTARMAEATLHAFGRIDGLVNNAALMTTLPRRPWHEIPLEEWDRVMSVNLRGLFLSCRAAWPALQQSRGAIVNLSSNRVFDGTPNRLHYTTSKAGVIGFTRALAREAGAFGVRVNAIAPGLTLSERQIASSKAEYLDEMARGRALTRPQTPVDLIGAILFFLSDASAFITGQTLIVDGGKLMR